MITINLDGYFRDPKDLPSSKLLSLREVVQTG